jgi:2-methylcitrate dehydratase PrpD
LADGHVTQSSFDENSRARMAEITTKVTVSLSPDVEARYPKAWGTDIEVRLSDGQVLQAAREQCKGDPENPVTSTEMNVKAGELLIGGGMRPDKAEQLIAVIADLINDRHVRDLNLFKA